MKSIVKQKILLLIGCVATLVGGAYAVDALYQRKADRAALAQQKASEPEQVFRELALVACKTAVERSVVPAKVLDWPAQPTGRRDWGFMRTDTGFRIDLFADLGGAFVRKACYHDKAGVVMQVVDAV